MALELLLSATRGSWQIAAHHGGEQDGAKPMKEWRPKILERDKYTCQFCGFKAPKWQEIHHLNDDHNDFSQGNLVTACAFCHQCVHLGVAGSTGGGEVIWLPELTQIELNHLARALFVALRDEKSKVHSAAHGLHGSLKSRGIFMEQHFAAGASDPGSLGQVFLKMKKDEYEGRASFLKNIRLLPQPARFEPQIKYWAESVYRDLSPESWERLVDKTKLS